jgi:putative MATE family efflux protein
MKPYLNKFKDLASTSWAVSWPMTLIMFFEFLMGLADVYVAGKIGKEIQAAYGLAFQLYFIGFIPVIALTAGTVSVVSRLFTAQGENSKQQLAESIFSSLLASFIMGIVVSAVGRLFSQTFITIIKTPLAIREQSNILFRIYSLGFIFEYFLVNSNGVLRSSGRVKVSLRNYFIMCVLNVILNFALAFKTPLGFRGIAVATVISVATAALLNFLSIKKLLSYRKFNYANLKSMLNIGWPIGVLQILWNLSIVVIYSILARLPKGSIEIIAAFTNGLKVESAIFLPAFAFNLANAVVVGNLLGQEKKKEAFGAGVVTAFLGMAIIAFLSLAVILSAGYLVPFLSDNAVVIKNNLSYLYIILLFEPIMAWGIILAGGLVGAGHTKSVLVSVILAVWLVRIPLCYFMGIVLGYGAIGIWWSINISVALQSIFLSWVYLRKSKNCV